MCRAGLGFSVEAEALYKFLLGRGRKGRVSRLLFWKLVKIIWLLHPCVSDIFQEDIFSSSLEELQSRENVVCACVQLEGGKHRNHFCLII